MATPLEAYLRDLWLTHASGEAVAELAFYPALRNLLDEVGRHLAPPVRCVMNLRNVGAGLPDGRPMTGERYRLADTADAFWEAAREGPALDASYRAVVADAWGVWPVPVASPTPATE